MEELHEISLRERIRLNLVSAMKKANLNQVQLADKLGISKGTVNNWVRGNNSPDVDIVPQICKVLSISVLDLYLPTEYETRTGEDYSSIAEATQRGEQTGADPLSTILLQNFYQLNREGQERLVETSDDMVSSGKYIKNNPDKLGNAKYA